ncbi:substrate-binding domain-containing protein [Limimaricola cinnabarinus]|uniref:substrate-binding domain-containing protein n=1 Tax=Limimaricola cinnabarinus TaxID=1125964 RepID=UPI000D7C6BB7
MRSDNRAGMRLAVDHLAALRHRDITFLSDLKGKVLDTELRAGVVEALASHGLALPGARFGSRDFSLEAGRAAAEFVALAPTPRR